MAVVAVACTTAPEALALFRHLAWWVLDEAEFAAPPTRLRHRNGAGQGSEPLPRHAHRTGHDPAGRPVRSPRAYFPRRSMPVIDLRSRVSADAPEDEDAPNTVAEWEAVTPVRPDTAHVRALRFLDIAGEALTALVLIARGRVRLRLHADRLRGPAMKLSNLLRRDPATPTLREAPPLSVRV